MSSDFITYCLAKHAIKQLIWFLFWLHKWPKVTKKMQVTFTLKKKKYNEVLHAVVENLKVIANNCIEFQKWAGNHATGLSS